MGKTLPFLAILLPAILFSQRPNKTIYDSIFQVGDIIRIPEILLGGGCLCRVGHEVTEQRDSLDKTGNFLVKYPAYVFQIESYTDSRGPEYGNLMIYLRSENTLTYLLNYFALDTNMVRARGFGESSPIISEQEIRKAKTEDAKEKLYQQNRRTQLRIIGLK